MQDLLEAIEARLRDLLVPVDVLVPWTNGSLSGEIHKVTVSSSPLCLLPFPNKARVSRRSACLSFQIAVSCT